MINNLSELATFTFWKSYWITMRPYLLFVSAAAGVVGFVVGPQRGIGVSLAVFSVFFLSYGFGQALTDCFQMDTDSLSSPYRPLVQGVISRQSVMMVSLAGLLGEGIVLFLLNPLSLIFTFLAVFGLATYTYFKRKWWAGPIYNGWIVALLPLIAILAAQGKRPSSAFIDMLSANKVIILIMLSVFFSYANFVLMGYFKDISADRASGYNTFVVVYGWKKAAAASDVLALLSLIFPAWVIFSIWPKIGFNGWSWAAVFIYLAGLAAVVTAQLGIHHIKDENKAYRPISFIVRGFILLHLAEICALRPIWLPWIVLFYLAFELVLAKRPERRQV